MKKGHSKQECLRRPLINPALERVPIAAIVSKSRKFVSLFSGCGGFDLGMIRAGFQSAGAFEIDAAAAKVFRSNVCEEINVCDLSQPLHIPARLKGLGLVIAGPPCQGFSTVGKRDFDDARNNLLVRSAELAVQMNPKAILIENVAGVVAGKHKRYWDRALSVLRNADFKTTELQIRGTDLGLAQNRNRMMILAWRTRFDSPVELPNLGARSLRDVLAGVKVASNHIEKHLAQDTDSQKIATKILPNQKLSNVRASSRAVHTWQIPEVFGRTNKTERVVLEGLLKRRRQKRKRDFGDADPVAARDLYHFVGFPVKAVLETLVAKQYVRRVEGSYDLKHTFNGKFRRLCWDSASPTVDSKFGEPSYFLHPSEHRGFTVREAARLQGFPDRFEFSGARKAQYKMIGNAVPPPIAKVLGELIRKGILKQ